MLIISRQPAEVNISSFYELLRDFSFEQGHIDFDDFLRDLLIAGVGDNSVCGNHSPAEITRKIDIVYEISRFMRNIGHFNTPEFTRENSDIQSVISVYQEIKFDIIEQDIVMNLIAWVADDNDYTAQLDYIARAGSWYKSIADFIRVCRDISASHEAEKRGGAGC